MARWSWLFVVLGMTFVQLSSEQSVKRNKGGVSIRLPQCCPSQHAISTRNATCAYNPDSSFQPPILFKGSMMLASNIVEEVKGITLACENENSGTRLIALSLDGEHGTLILLPDGTVNVMWFPPEGLIYERLQDFCVLQVLDDESDDPPMYWAKACLQDHALQWQADRLACSNASCLRKCCPAGEHLKNKGLCMPDDKTKDWSLAPQFPDLHVVYGLPTCEKILIYDDHSLTETGNLLASEELLSPQHYCIDNNEDTKSDQVYELALVCFEGSADSECQWKYGVLVPVLMGISCACLTATWVIYLLVPRLKSCNTGRCLLSFVSATFFAFLTITINKAGRENFTELQCSLIATLCHASILAMFFWLNVMSFHIYFQLRSPHKGYREGVRVFLVYSLYAWGSAILITLVGVTLDALQADVIRPHFHLPNCWFLDVTSRWVYQYGIILVLILVNMVFFICSVMLLKRNDRYRVESGHNQTISAWVYLKLFIITGVLWITEIVSWKIGNQCNIAVIIIDIINSLQGVYIFLVAVCLRKDLKVFHWGCPQLAVSNEDSVPTHTGEDASELLDAQRRKE
ncbi:hypothetical protein OTU49_011235 [Cherax quadricarinatus]|uniref:G-protein coupled receptors family 2 profile 2 domain-containing protein n=1 Tax=Cherax quadricarinatus TaxID=27406 RepID=A0AAW0W4F4_CHEQU